MKRAVTNKIAPLFIYKYFLEFYPAQGNLITSSPMRHPLLQQVILLNE